MCISCGRLAFQIRDDKKEPFLGSQSNNRKTQFAVLSLWLQRAVEKLDHKGGTCESVISLVFCMFLHIHADASKNHAKCTKLVPKKGTISTAKKGGQIYEYLQSGFLFAGAHCKMIEDARWNTLKVQGNLR